MKFLNLSDTKNNMIFGKIEDQVKYVKAYQIILNAWADIMKNTPSPEEDPCTSGQAVL